MIKRLTINLCLLIALAIAVPGCDRPPAQPLFAPATPVQTVLLINAAGFAPTLWPALVHLDAIPTIRRLAETGANLRLAGPMPPDFAGTTTSMLTGQSLPDQGVDFWFYQDEAEQRLRAYTCAHLKAGLLSQRLAHRQQPSMTVFWPLLHPPPPEAGTIVSAGPIADRQSIDDFVFVPDLGLELEGRVTPSSLAPDVNALLSSVESDWQILDWLGAEVDADPDFWATAQQELLAAYRADSAAMRIIRSLRKPEHRLIAVNLVGLDVLGRRWYGMLDGRHFQIDESGRRRIGRVYVNYARWIDRFIQEQSADPKDDVCLILVSDHGLGPARPLDPHRRIHSGRPHPTGLCILSGRPIRAGVTDLSVEAIGLPALVLYLLGEPIPADLPLWPLDSMLNSQTLAQRPPTRLTGPDPSLPVLPAASLTGRPITPQERFLRFNEWAGPITR